MSEIFTFKPKKPPRGTVVDLTHSPVVAFDALDAANIEAVREDDADFLLRHLGYERRVCGMRYTSRGELDTLDIIVRGRTVRVHVGGCGASYRLHFATFETAEHVDPPRPNM